MNTVTLSTLNPSNVDVHSGILLRNCSVVDVENNEILQDSEVLLNGNRISTLGAFPHGHLYSEDLLVVDCEDAWIIPGLMDVHVHLCLEPDPALSSTFAFTESLDVTASRAVKNMAACLDAGVTLVRDLGAWSGVTFQLKRAIQSGTIDGPRLLTCGRLFTGESGWGVNLGTTVSGIDSIPRAVRQEIRDGADVIKVLNDPRYFSLLELKTFVDATHRAGKKAACHAYHEDLVSDAVEAGFDTIEHALPFDSGMAQTIRQKNITMVPTYICAIDSMDIERSLISQEAVPIFSEWLQILQELMPSAWNYGVRIAAGTDAGFPPVFFNSVIREVQGFVHNGVSPVAALQAATINAAEAVGMENLLGSVKPGKLADLLLLEENPLDDMQSLSHVRAVILNGRFVRNFSERKSTIK